MSTSTRVPTSLRMAVRSAGRGAPIVLLHGIPGSAANWRAVMGRLEHEFHVIAPDLIGFGESPRAARPLWAREQAEALAATLTELEVTRATIIGHDFGGPVALALWELDPSFFSALGLSATNAFPDTPIPFPLSTVLWPAVGRFFARVIFSPPSLTMMLRQGVAAPGVRLSPDHYIGDRAQANTIREIFHGSLLHLAERYGPLERILATVDVPTRVVWGAQDMFFSTEHGQRTAGAIANADLVVYDETGHFIPEERPERYARDIAELARQGR